MLLATEKEPTLLKLVEVRFCSVSSNLHTFFFTRQLSNSIVVITKKKNMFFLLGFFFAFAGMAGENPWLGSGWIQFLGKARNQYICRDQSREGEN